jgi:hypothetical protein
MGFPRFELLVPLSPRSETDPASFESVARRAMEEFATLPTGDVTFLTLQLYKSYTPERVPQISPTRICSTEQRSVRSLFTHP